MAFSLNPSTTEKIEDDQDERDHQEQMDQATGHVERESAAPEQQYKNGDNQ